jgi:hypothetical protein
LAGHVDSSVCVGLKVRRAIISRVQS